MFNSVDCRETKDVKILFEPLKAHIYEPNISLIRLMEIMHNAE